jgi:broad specificity phosphatase PhoE
VLYLVRHGQTAPNAAGVFLGRSDPPLTDLGLAQAQRLARTIPSPDRVVSSPLRRAHETARAFGKAVEVDDRWTELDYGELEGMHPSSVPADVWHRWRSDRTFAPPGGESLADLTQRVHGACADLEADAAGGVVVVVTHVSPVKAAIAWVLGGGELVAWRMWVEDAGVARIAIERDGPVLRSFNEHGPSIP